MTLSDIAAIASIVSSVAVAVSLVYVGLQVRQAERNQRGLMQQGRANRVSATLLELADPVLATVWVKGLQRPQALGPVELEQFMLIARAAFISGEDSFLQHKAGLLDETAFKSFAAGMRSWFAAAESLRAAWRILGGGFGTDFAAFVDAIVEDTPVQPYDRMTTWRAQLATPSPPAPTAADDSP